MLNILVAIVEKTFQHEEHKLDVGLLVIIASAASFVDEVVVENIAFQMIDDELITGVILYKYDVRDCSAAFR